jgi:SAM-dependent methyltransferase
MTSPFAELHRAAWSAWARRRYRAAFDDVETFCLFVGYPRSGHSLVGALLNAHRHAVIAHELDVARLVLAGGDRDTIFAQVLARAAWFDLRGNTSNYRYQVPNQWQGRFERLRVVGDKRGGSAALAIEEHPDLLARLAAAVRVPLRLIHVVRHPLDNIAAIALWHRWSVDESIAYYFRLCRVTAGLTAERGDITAVHHEELVAAPRAALVQLCAFLRLEPESAYLADCESLVAEAPRPTRRHVDWSGAQLAEVARRSAEHPFLARYEIAVRSEADGHGDAAPRARRSRAAMLWPRFVERWLPTERPPAALARRSREDSPPPGASGMSRDSWDEAARRLAGTRSLGAWYAYMRRVYGALLVDWLPQASRVRLKTDLFEEAVSAAHPLADLGGRRLGVDLAIGVASAARRRLAEARDVTCLVADVRTLPLGDGTVESILSGSSIDHFASRVDVRASLAELARVLAPGGTLVLTLDNPHNPLIWLRNRLPFRLLRAAGLVPYYVGVTLGRQEAERELAAVGLRVVEWRAVAHAPRAPAIFLLRRLARREGSEERIARALAACERLASWPTRRLTGYYLAFRAVRPGAET